MSEIVMHDRLFEKPEMAGQTTESKLGNQLQKLEGRLRKRDDQRRAVLHIMGDLKESNERLANQRKDRNHKLSRRLVAEHQTIVWSKDDDKGLARSFGKSVASAAHAQLRTMLAYKCTASGRRFVEVPSRFSTKTCSACGSLSGPTGYAGLSVRQWQCADCGSAHDRDVNAAINTLHAGVGTTHERRCKTVAGIPCL